MGIKLKVDESTLLWLGFYPPPGQPPYPWGRARENKVKMGIKAADFKINTFNQKALFSFFSTEPFSNLDRTWSSQTHKF
jgi:hypothetical protein